METPTTSDFQAAIDEIFDLSVKKGEASIEVKAGDLHRRVGGYPGPNHRMPTCCKIMRDVMVSDDVVLHEPLKGQGATLEIRYKLPR